MRVQFFLSNGSHPLPRQRTVNPLYVGNHVVHGPLAPFVKRICRVTPRTTQVAGGQADEDARASGVRRFALD